MEEEPKKKSSQAVTKILKKMEELDTLGIKPTQVKVAKLLGITQQSVNKTLTDHRSLDEFTKPFRNRINSLRDIDTSNLSIKEIYELPQIKSFTSYTKLRKLVYSEGIPHKESALDRLKTLDTASYSVKELSTILEVHQRTVRKLLADNKMPYKRASKKLA